MRTVEDFVQRTNKATSVSSVLSTEAPLTLRELEMWDYTRRAKCKRLLCKHTYAQTNTHPPLRNQTRNASDEIFTGWHNTGSRSSGDTSTGYHNFVCRSAGKSSSSATMPLLSLTLWKYFRFSVKRRESAFAGHSDPLVSCMAASISCSWIPIKQTDNSGSDQQ